MINFYSDIIKKQIITYNYYNISGIFIIYILFYICKQLSYIPLIIIQSKIFMYKYNIQDTNILVILLHISKIVILL